MTTTTIFEKIQNELHNMSNAKKKIGTYLLENWQESAFLSAHKLARNVGVSESVVVRFAQDLNYSGFPELQKAIQNVLRNRLTGYSSENKDTESSLESTGESSEHIHRVLNLTMDNLKGIAEVIQQEVLLKATKLIFKSRRIVVIASRNAMGPAIILSTHLNEIFNNTIYLASGQDDVHDHIRGLGKEDLIVTISLPGYSRSTVRVAEFCHEREIPQITITDSYNSPLANYSDIVLLTHFKSYSYAMSHVGTVFIIDLLIYLITINDNGKVLKSLEESELLNQKYGIYLN